MTRLEPCDGVKRSTPQGTWPRPDRCSRPTTRSRRGSEPPTPQWPDGTLDRLNRLAGLHQRSAVVQLHLGLAQFWAGEPGSTEAWGAAAEAEPDTLVRGSRQQRALPPLCAEAARVRRERCPAGGVRPPPTGSPAKKRSSRGPMRRSVVPCTTARRCSGSAASSPPSGCTARQRRRYPNEAEAQTAAAVGLFDKSAPARAFGKLGPLTRRFPRAATVRFHLGLLLLWSGSLKEAKRQFALAEKAEPGSPLALEAAEVPRKRCGCRRA